MSTNLARLNQLLPGSTRHTARVAILQDIIIDLCKDEKLAKRACWAFGRFEKALYYLNPQDRPTVQLTRKQIATRSRVNLSTLARDLQAINDLFDATEGLRLQHWESGGWIKGNDEDAIPSVYHWPSPGGRIIELATDKIEMAIANQIIPPRNEYAERKIIQEFVLKEINDPFMQEVLKERKMNQTLRKAKLDDRKDDRVIGLVVGTAVPITSSPAKLIPFPERHNEPRTLTPKENLQATIRRLKDGGEKFEDIMTWIAEEWGKG